MNNKENCIYDSVNEVKRVHRSRFTLMELLVIVAIIGILVTLLLPSLRKARETSRNVICISNINQLGISAFAFSKENSGRLPSVNHQYSGRVWVGREGTDNNYSLAVTQRPLNSFLGYKTDGMETPLVVCPSTPEDFSENNYILKGTTYFGNEHHKKWNGISNVNIASINNPSKVVVMRADGTDSRVNGANSIWWRAYHKEGKSIYPFSFVDGSASFKEVKTGEGVSFDEGDFILDLSLDQ